MTRSLPAAITGQLDSRGPRPFWVVQIDFSTPLRLANREPMTVGGDGFEWAGLFVNTASGEIAIDNEESSFTSTFFDADTARVRVRVWEGRGEGRTWAYADLKLELDGFLGDLSIGQQIGIRVRRNRPVQTPGLVIGDVVSEAHLMPDGAIARTPSGNIKITHT